MLMEAIAIILTRLAALIEDTTGEFDGAKIALFDETFTPNSAQTYAAMAAAECTVTGYARSAALVWLAPYADASNRGVILGDPKSFTATVDPAGALCGGYAIVNAAGTGLLWAEQFVDEAGAPAPKAFVKDKPIIVLPKYVYGRQAA